MQNLSVLYISQNQCKKKTIDSPEINFMFHMCMHVMEKRKLTPLVISGRQPSRENEFH